MSSLAEIIRRRAFWLRDGLKGGRIKKHYTAIRQLLENHDAREAENTKQTSLTALLHHACITTAFYQPFKNTASLQDFPVISKTLVRENFKLFTSGAFTTQKQIPVVTSGSTGTPFKVLHNADKRSRNTADTMYFAHRAGFTVGEKLLYLKIWSANNKKSGLLAWMQNVVPVDVITFNDTAIEKLVTSMESSRSAFNFLGYSSALELVCRYLDKTGHGKVKAKVLSAISMSEALNEYTKVTFGKYFGVQALSRYSNLENGILAQQMPESGNRYLINTASYLIEILKMDSDMAAGAGEMGRLVVTDLYNYAMPLIRYDTGDIAAMSHNSDSAGNQYLETVEGRKLDLLFATDGSLVSSYIVYKNMWQYTEISQYQLVQYGPAEYLFKINMNGVFSREPQLVREFKHYLGQDAVFTVEYVDEIPLLASGKRKKIMNTYHP